MEQAVYEDMHRLERTHWWFRARREILSRVVENTVPRGGSILDVGCGTGFMLEHLRSQYDVHGLDDHQIAVDLCHKKGLDFVEQGLLGKSKLPRESYDMVMFLDVIEHVDDDVDILKNGERVLARGGSMLVTVPALQMLWSGHDVVHHHRRRYSKEQLEASLRAAGLEPRYISYFNTLLFPLVFAARMAGKLRGNGASDTNSDADAVPPGPINELLYRAFKSEKLVVPRMKLPIGVSLVCVAGRPGETPMHETRPAAV